MDVVEKDGGVQRQDATTVIFYYFQYLHDASTACESAFRKKSY